MNRDRDHYINAATALEVLRGCNSHDWRVIFSLARYGGLRRCELVTLTWDDVLWDANKIRIDSPKTGLRFAPLFPELRGILSDAFEAAEPGTVCVTKYRRRANLGTQMNRIIERAGVETWPKTFQNLRASRRTELEKQHPNHVVNAWLGHGKKVADTHYLQVTDEDWTEAIGSDEAANQFSGALHGALDTNPTSSPVSTDMKKPYKMQGDDDSGLPQKSSLAPPARLELATRRLTAACSTN